VGGWAMSKTAKIVPVAVSDFGVVLGGNISDLLPDWDDIPERFKAMNDRWARVVTDWFFRGLKDAKWTPKPGVDEVAALRHVKAVMASWEPKHEHKEAGCAYLLSEFFEDVTYTPGKLSQMQ